MFAAVASAAFALAGCGSGEEPSAPGSASTTTPAAPAASTSPATQAQVPTVVTAVEAQTSVRNAVSMVEACFTDTENYRRCTKPVGGSLGVNTGLRLVATAPKPGEVQVVALAKDAYKALSPDSTGARYILVKQPRTGLIKRNCRLASGQVCSPATW
jgi:hypothetical protein